MKKRNKMIVQVIFPSKFLKFDIWFFLFFFFDIWFLTPSRLPQNQCSLLKILETWEEEEGEVEKEEVNEERGQIEI